MACPDPPREGHDRPPFLVRRRAASRPDGSEVEVFLPAGALSGLNEMAAIRHPDGVVEVWPRSA